MFGLLSLLAGSAGLIPPTDSITWTDRLPDSLQTTQTPEQQLVSWMPGPVRCDDGAEVRVIEGRRPYNSLWAGHGTQPSPMVLEFAIDPTGRPLSIRRTSPAFLAEVTAGPALASSRFEAGAVRENCSITYQPMMRPVDEAEPVELASYMMTNQKPHLPSEAYERLHASDECRPRTQPLMRAYPNFDEIPATRGVRDWTMIGFDVTASGETTNVRHLYGTGNEALAEASVEAVENSRFTKGTLRRNCSYPYWRNAAVLPPPPAPPRSPDRTDPCKALEWDRAPQRNYPTAYSARSIEGWADIAFDVATWGEIGNVRVLRAQPTDDFGEAAKRMIERSRAQKNAGLTGCETRVYYRVEGSGAPEQTSADS